MSNKSVNDDSKRGRARGERHDMLREGNQNGSVSSDSSKNSSNSARVPNKDCVSATRNTHNTRRYPLSHGSESNHSTYVNTSISSDQQEIPESIEEIPGTNLGPGSCVKIKSNETQGVIRWIGRLQNGTVFVGIETNDEIMGPNIGWEMHQKFKEPFVVEKNKVMHVDASDVEIDPQFNDTDVHHLTTDSDDSPLKKYRPLPLKAAVPVNKIIALDHLHQICGKYKGIQGHHNSCYLDATLFSMFAFTDVFDSLLNKEYNEKDFPVFDFQRILRDCIVNPLRIIGCVPWQQVMSLRKILDIGAKGYTKEEKDPEEFLNMLFVDVFKAEPLLKLNSGQGSFFYQLFVEKDERLTFPTVQQLFDQSFSSSDVKLTEIPSCLIIQMPRFGNKYKMYPQILPSHVLDITDILEDSPRQCTLCGKLADQECVDCFNTANEVSLETSTFCHDCFAVYHRHNKRSAHLKVKKINNKSDSIDTFKKMDCNVERIFMDLFAVVCIETSHYVSFVKTGAVPNAPWCFFDSMADRVGGANGFNIPEITPEEEISAFLSEDSTNFQKLTKQAKRLLGDAYLCMYQSDDLRKYK